MRLIGTVLIVACLLLLLLAALGPPERPVLWAGICGVAALICYLPIQTWPWKS